jgi:hypothetical protein
MHPLQNTLAELSPKRNAAERPNIFYPTRPYFQLSVIHLHSIASRHVSTDLRTCPIESGPLIVHSSRNKVAAYASFQSSWLPRNLTEIRRLLPVDVNSMLRDEAMTGLSTTPQSKPWIYIILLALLTYYLILTARSYWRLRHFKGPPLAAISHLWYIQAAVRNRTYLSLSEACDKYGSFPRFCFPLPYGESASF